MSDTSETRATPEAFAAEIVAAYVSNNPVSPAELPGLIDAVRAALGSLGAPPPAKVEPEPLVPAVSIKKSVTPDHLVCLECGKSFKSLKRHLLTHHNLSPETYRQRWSLAATYPMVAPNYADARSQLALSMGLGRKRGAEPAEGEEMEAGIEAPAEETAAAETLDGAAEASLADAAPEAADADAGDAAAEAPAPKKRGGGRRKAASA